MSGICSARRASQKSITQSAVNFGNCKWCYSEKRGEGKGDRIDTVFLTKINTRGIAWRLALVSRSSQTELTLERRYFWLLHYAPCPEKLWHLHPPTTYTTALVFHSKCYKSLSNFGFPRHDNKPFPSQRSKTSPRTQTVWARWEAGMTQALVASYL